MAAMHLPRRTTIAALLAVVLLAGCGGEDTQATGDEKIKAAEALEATTTTVDPWAVPDPIDAAYVQRVIQELEDIHGEIRYDVWRRHQFDEKSKERVRAIHDEPYLSFAMQTFSDDSTKEHPEFKDVPEGPKVTVVELLTAQPECIYAVVNLDANAIRVTPTKTYNFGTTLNRSDHNRINGTGWKIVESRSVDGYPKDDLCRK